MESHLEISALLEFYRAAGVDESIGKEPVNRFLKAAEAAPAPPQMPAHPVASARPAANNAPAPASAPLKSLEDAVRMARALADKCTDIESLAATVAGYDGCSLRKLAMNTVFAEGDPTAKLMIIDRPPSVDEDRSGKPFAGPAGELLDKMLAAIGLARTDVYLASLLPWRPPGGRAPTAEELALCLPFIERHIALAKPKALLVCGEAAGYLLNRKSGINKLRGSWVDYASGKDIIRMLPIFHPAFLLDYPAAKKHAWRDLLQLKAALEGE